MQIGERKISCIKAQGGELEELCVDCLPKFAAQRSERCGLEEKLRVTEALFRAVFETSHSAKIIFDNDMTVAAVNKAFENQTGFLPSEVIKRKKMTDIVCKEDVKKLRHCFQTLNGGASALPGSCGFRYRTKGGEIREATAALIIISETGQSMVSFLDITKSRKAEAALKRKDQELRLENRKCEELNTTLRVLLDKREEDKTEIEGKILSNIKELILPYINKLKKEALDSRCRINLGMLESNLKDIISPFTHKLSVKFLNFTPKELQICKFIKEGKTTKEIAQFMNVSTRAIDVHRYNIRHKLGLNKKNVNLQSYLNSI